MKRVLAFLALLVVVKAQSGGDDQFCTAHMGTDHDTLGQKSKPTFPKVFVAHIEQTRIQAKQVYRMEQEYSQDLKLLHVEFGKLINTTDIWIDVNKQRSLSVTADSGDTDLCEYLPISVAPSSSFFGVQIDDSGKGTLKDPDAVFRFEPEDQAIYVGDDIIRGGIPTEKWQVCQYMEDMGTTLVASFFFAAANVTTPHFPGALLLSSFIAKPGAQDPYSNMNSYSFRYDYVNMGPLTLNQVNHLVPPPHTFCWGEDTIPTMPKMPTKFSFRSEITDLGDPANEVPKPHLIFTKEEYMESLGLFYYEFEFEPEDGDSNYGQYLKTLHDYNIGLSYQIDLIIGECSVTQIDPTATDAKVMKFKNVTMRDPQDFFGLDGQFLYVGQRRHQTRSIDCDVYISWSNGILTNWYFATSEWKKTKFKYQVDKPLPVAMETIGNGAHQITNFYDYSTEAFNSYPDIALCFDASDSVLTSITLTGGAYHTVYLGAASTFKELFVLALMENGLFFTPSRVAELDVLPAGVNNLTVEFIILGKPKVKGDVVMGNYPTAKSIYDNLRDNIKSGSFVFTVYDSAGNARGTLTAQSTTKRSASAKPYFSSSSSGFSGGSMAGIAIGLLALGLLLGIAGIFLLYRRRSHQTTDLKLEKLENSSRS